MSSTAPVVPDMTGGPSTPASLAKAAPPSYLTTFSSLKHRDYRLLWTSNLLATAGNWIQQVTLGWLVYEMTGSAFLVGALMGARSLPFLVAGPVGGVLSDRLDRRKLLMVNQTLLGLLALGFALLVWSGGVRTWHIFVFAALSGIGWAMNNPVRQALVANTVPRQDLRNAVALNSVGFNFTRMAGPAAAGFLIAFFGPSTNFMLQALCYLGVALLALVMRVRPIEHVVSVHASPVSSFWEGITYVRREQAVLAFILVAMVPSLFVMPFTTGLMPVFAKDVLQQGPDGLGLLLAALGVGGVIGSLAVASFNARRPGVLQIGAGVLCGLGIIAFSRSPSMAVALPLLISVGTAQMFFFAINNMSLQTITPDALRGRVMSIYMLDHALVPLGSFMAGTLADLYGSPWAVLVGGSVAASLILLVGFRFRVFRESS
ncbi:MAG: MFS transporter [Chloroflexi bacterium]|nr:MFS transporter [Chloroflexota bacterium]